MSRDDQEAALDTLQSAHIISQCLSDGIKGGSKEARKKFNWANTTGAIIEQVGGISIRNLLGSENLNNPRNAMMLAPVARNIFDGLDLWLTPFEDHGNFITDKHEVNLTSGVPGTWTRAIPPLATFTTHTLPSDKKIESPSPQLTALHAACAQIARISICPYGTPGGNV